MEGNDILDTLPPHVPLLCAMTPSILVRTLGRLVATRRPDVVITACAVSVVRRLTDRSACSVVWRVLRWRSAGDMAAMPHISGGHLWGCSRGLLGLPRLRWGEPYLKLAGLNWWEQAGSWRPGSVVGKMWQGAYGGEDAPPEALAMPAAARFPT